VNILNFIAAGIMTQKEREANIATTSFGNLLAYQQHIWSGSSG